MTEKLQCFGLGRNIIVGKEKMLVTSIFSHSPTIFSNALFLGVIKSSDCVVKTLSQTIRGFYVSAVQVF